jgi:drug/metabolite transporter (DMT)-like permease
MWVVITLAAAMLQITRTSIQHGLRHSHDAVSAAAFRFTYGAPVALVVSIIVFGPAGVARPGFGTDVVVVIIAAGVAQILATVALLLAFRTRDFSIGTVYSKAEVPVVAALGAIGLGPALTPWGWVGAALVVTGVVVLAVRRRDALGPPWDPAALIGAASGALFAAAATGIGAAAERLDGGSSFTRALFTLTIMLCVQAALMGAWSVVGPGITASGAGWAGLAIGVFSMLGSLAWAWGFTLAGAARVRTLGQVEVLIAFAAGAVMHAERHRRHEYAAAALVLTGVVLVAAAG